MGGVDFPRYVDTSDREILKILAGNAPVPIDRIVATGRARWQSLSGTRPLRADPHRNVLFAWRVLPNGDQQLHCETDPSLVTLLDIEPPAYIDAATGTVGRLQSDQPLHLIGEYWLRPPVTPEEVTATNEQLQRDAQGAPFPALRTLPLQQQSLSNLSARLVLTAGPTATLYFVYNGLPVDSNRLRDEHAAARQMMDGVLYEIPRDPQSERQWRARLADVLPTASHEREAWLDFMLHGLPALQAEHWEVITQDDFPYRVAAADDWYGDLESDHRQGWFNLRLGVMVDGQQVNLLPALARYLQTTLAGGQTSLPTNSAAIVAGGATPTDSTPAPDTTVSADLAATTEPINGNELANATATGSANASTGTAVPTGANSSAGSAAPTNAAAPASATATPKATRRRTTTPDGDAGCRVGEQWLVQLDDGRYLPIAVERIQRIANTLVELFDRDGLTKQEALSLPRSHTGRVAQLSRELSGSALRTEAPDLRALLDDFAAGGGIQPLAAPAHFRAELRPYQQEGLGWLQFLRRHHLGGILADDMGLGKTVQTLAHLALEKQQGRLQKPSLIVAPVSTLGNWQQELHRFAPELDCLVLHGSRRRESFQLIGKVDVVITGYPLLQLDSEVLLAHDYYLIILDEAQTIKNPRAKVSAMARALRAEHRLALTGTPVENHLGELWSLFDFAQPGLLGEERQFQRHYRTPIEKDGHRTRARALAQRVAPFLLRRTKDAVARELPPKTEIVETIALDERQRDFYDGIRLASHRQIQELVRQQGLARSQITILDALLKLRQACCDPRLLAVADAKEDVPSAKLEWLSDTLPELVEAGRCVLLFSQFTSMLRLIEQAVTALGIPYCLLTGATQNRTEVIARFQSGDVPLFLISLKAGGTGLNLTAADTVIHYDPWWNPAVEAQATDRAHRIGQDKPVFVYKLIAQGTVEERILQLQADKHALASRLYTEGTSSPSSWTAADIEALFAP